MKSLTSRLYLTGQTVFTASEISLLWQETVPENLKSKINYYCKSGVLTPLRRGIYALSGKPYSKFELANRIFTPSYISLETVLAAEGIVFQHDDTIVSVSYQTRDVTIDDQPYRFRRLNPRIVTHPVGIENRGTYSIASKERAFLDSLYLDGPRQFDHLDSLDWDLCRQLLPLYQKTQLVKRFAHYARR